MNLSFCVRLLIFGSVHGSEWFTSGGNHCTERCKIGPKNDLGEFFWCPVVDGFYPDQNTVASSRPSKQDPQNGQTGEEKIKWDYCTPAVSTDMIKKEEFETNSTRNRARKGRNVNAVKRPTKLNASSLARKDCMGPCRKDSEEKFQCDIPGSSPDHFYCSPEFVLQRNQISSQKKLWCTGPCLKEEGGDHYECMTLFGSDRCSPTANTSTSGKTCFSNCQEGKFQYQCYTDDTMDDCGLWSSSWAGMKALEYTVGDQICASKCEDVDGNHTCSYVQWEWKDDTKMAILTLHLGSCVPYTPSVQMIGAQVGVDSGNFKRSKREIPGTNITTKSTNTPITNSIEATSTVTETTTTESEITNTANNPDPNWRNNKNDYTRYNATSKTQHQYNTTATEGYIILGWTVSKYDNWKGIYVYSYNVSTPNGMLFNQTSDCSINNVSGFVWLIAQVYGISFGILLIINLWNWPKPKPLTIRWWRKVRNRKNREYVVVELFWSFVGVCYFSFVFGWEVFFNFYGIFPF